MEENKKAERKRRRFAARLRSSKGVICTDVPSPNIVLCNAGQATGLEKEMIHSFISHNVSDLSMPKYIAEKGETYSYLVFESVAAASQFYNKCNGKLKIDENGTPLYMNYVENVPSTDIIINHPDPKGLLLINDFISEVEELEYLKLFDWIDDKGSSSLKNRQVKHYGFEFRYGSNDVDLNDPLEEKIPIQCDKLWSRLRAHGLDVGQPDQLTVNKYTPGQGIPSHVDKHSPFGSTILSISLGSSILMDWKHHSGKYVPVLVKRRSLLVMQDEARYDWQHGIQPRTWDPIIKTQTLENGRRIKLITNDTISRGTRISLTFRWTRSARCQCVYKTLCDSVENRSTDDLEDDLASNLEDLHVHQVYEKIAGHFSTTRHKPWPKVVEFMRNVPTGAVVLDLGCGNGKNILPTNDILQIAGERSIGLLSECKEHVAGISAADCVRLDLLHASLKDECADVVICIAVIHHFSSRARRLQSLSTIYRLLRPSGKALITVWAKDQTKANYLCKTKSQPTTNQVETVLGINLPVHENRTQFQHKDLLVPWKLRNVSEKRVVDEPKSTLLRYYHVFEEDELASLCREVNLCVEKSFYEEGNWCVVCTKA
ncbi:hypothetical protein K1T71_005302 [Dendrolimus kikuchii]|uniref:Uncharacterized protein n=1 Tax=Dendrolimus kikuchii TaxID=765133 RepID=A0ACC1D6Z3_9NEOP|nr:hypothetical protein K1T71_005302 [Dendrolimus kikuchii]